MRLRVLSGTDIERALPMAEAIEAVGLAFMEVVRGRALAPPRSSLATGQGVSLVMSAHLPDLPGGAGLSLKVVSVYPANPGRGLPTIHSLALLLDDQTGAPLALLEGARLTALRTGAASGAATRLLAPPRARTLALLGAGGQAWDQVRAVLAVRPIEELRVYTPSGESARRLAERAGRQWPGLRAFAVDSAARALAGAEVVCCATTSRAPVFGPADLTPGAHVNGVGSFTPEMLEVPAAGLLAREPDLGIFIDEARMTWLEAGELIAARDQGLLDPARVVELGRVLMGEHPGRAAPGQTTFFKSVGLAAQDAAAGRAALARAESLGLGVLLEL